MGNAGARLGLSVGGALLGAALTGGSPVGFAIGGMIGGIAGSLLFPDKVPDQMAEGPKLGDLSIQTSTYGNAIPVIYGTVRVAGNVIWSTGLIEHVNTITQDVDSGKGGSTPTSTVTTYTYTVSMAVSLCNNQIVGIKRIWADDKLWYNFANPPIGVSFSYEIYTGSETQLPCSAIEAHKGAGNVPAFRGQAYIVFKDLDLTKFGNRVPNLHFEVVVAGAQSLTPTYYTDTAPTLNGWFNRVEIDTETGLVWYTRSSLNKIFVVTPDLELVQTLENKISWPYMLSYQPPYQYLDMPAFGPLGIGQVPTVREMEPRMWVSCAEYGLINIGGAMAGEVDTRDYEVRLNNSITGVPLPFQPFGGIVEVDMRTIHVEDINGEGTQFVHFCGSNVNNHCYTTAIADYFHGVFGNYRENPEFNNQGLFYVEDFVANDSTMLYAYVLWHNGTIWACDKYMNPVYQVQTIVNFAGSFDRLVWDKFERKLYAIINEYSTGRVYLVKYSEDLQTVHWSIYRVNIQAFYSIDIHPNTGALYALSKDFAVRWHLHEIDKVDGSYLTDYEVVGSEGRIWMDMKIYPNSMFAMVVYVGPFVGPGIARMPLTPAPTGTPPTLQSVVENICAQAGLAPADVNASALASDFVTGYALAQRMPARSAIEPLMRGFFFEGVESDFVAKFVKRGGASVKTISYLDSGAIEPGSTNPPPQRDRQRMEENELPWQVDVNYLDPVSLYKTSIQYARRLIGQSKTVASVQIPVVFTATQAKRIAEVLLYNAWVERQSATVKVSKEYLDLDPTDIVTFASAPNLPLLDDFDRPNQTPPTKWDTQAGTGMKLEGGTMRAVDVAADNAAIYSEVFYPDVEVEVTVGWMDHDGVSTGWAIALRKQANATWASATNDHYELLFLNVTSGSIIGQVKWRKQVGGVFTDLTALIPLAAFKYGDRIRVASRGSILNAYVNDVRVAGATDTDIVTGNYVGLLSHRDASEIREVHVGPYAVPITQDYRVTKAEYTAPNLIELGLVEEDTSVYTALGIGIDADVPSQAIPSLVPTLVFFLDTSIMGREADDNVGFYFAGGGSFGDSWPGAGLYRSDNSGTSYVAVTEFPSAVSGGPANSTLTYEGSIP